MYIGLEQLYKNLRKDLSDEAKEDFTNAIGKLLHFIELFGKNVSDKSKKYLKMNNSYVSYKKMTNNPVVMFSIRSCMDVASYQFGDSFTLFVRGEYGKLTPIKCDPAKALKIAVDEIDKFCSKQFKTTAGTKMSIFINKKTGKLVTAGSKNEVLALDMDRVKDSTKLLYDKMNQGDLQYYCRQDDNFEDYVNSTLEDEIHDTIKSDKNLINDCVARRKSNESIVWNALYRVFQYVNKRWKINTNISSDKMKNWFVTNGTDYKKALAKIISNLTDFRDELRETEKSTEVKSSKTTTSIMISCENGLDNLEGKIKEFKKLLTRITSFIARRKSKYKYVVEDDVFGSTECSHIWRVTNNEDKSISIKITLDDGFTTNKVKCFVRYGRDSFSQTQNPWKYIEDFLD